MLIITAELKSSFVISDPRSVNFNKGDKVDPNVPEDAARAKKAQVREWMFPAHFHPLFQPSSAPPAVLSVQMNASIGQLGLCDPCLTKVHARLSDAWHAHHTSAPRP
jgi:hypothetical protein